MSIAKSQTEIKGNSLVELAEQLEASIRKAAQEGKSLYEVESAPDVAERTPQRRKVRQTLLTMSLDRGRLVGHSG